MKTRYYLPLLILFGIFCKYAYGQDTAATEINDPQKPDTFANTAIKGFDFFDSDELLDLTLSFDVSDFRNKRSREKYYEATLTVHTNSGDSISQNIKLKARGNMRLCYCSFPPVLLKLKGGEKGDERPLGKGSLKLVNPCSRLPMFKDYILKEYLTYKMYNVVTPYSFRTRLVRIHYVDINTTKDDFTVYGFLIEDEDKMAERNHAVIIKSQNATQKNMIPADMARVAVFNYMIGNTDWSVPYQHNIKILKSMAVPSEKGIPVAYDFDFSGFVNTGYSAPAEALPIKSVKERYYMGYCFGDDELKPIIEEIMDKKQQILGTIDNFDYLSAGDKKQAKSYLNSFFKTYQHKDYLTSDLDRTCIRF